MSEEMRDRARFVWSQGNYAEVAKILEPAAEAIVDAGAIANGTYVLDVAAGNGNVAIAAARRGARVVATDITPSLVEQGRARSAEEGLSIEWGEADAEDLPYDDDTFDVVTSSFGAMFAPHGGAVAKEMLRVTKPGGKVVMTAWDRDGYIGNTLGSAGRFQPPPPEGVTSPLDWGDEATARQRFEEAGAAVEVRRGVVPWRFPSARAWEEWAEVNVPPIVVAKMLLPPETFEELRVEQQGISARFNKANDGTLDADGEYLLIIATKPGGA